MNIIDKLLDLNIEIRISKYEFDGSHRVDLYYGVYYGFGICKTVEESLFEALKNISRLNNETGEYILLKDGHLQFRLLLEELGLV